MFSGEEEVALSMTSHLLRNLGATEEQVARERRVNRRLLAGEKPEEDDAETPQTPEEHKLTAE